MINRGLLLVFLLLLTLVGFISCSDDEEVPQLAEVSGDLVAAVRQGDVSLVTEIISDNPENVADILNTRVPPAARDAGLTPLMIAARDIDNSELVKLLVSNGADASLTTDPQGWTALLYALAFNKSDAVTEEVLKADNPNKDQKLAVAYQPTDADLLRTTPLSSETDAGYVPVGATGLILATFISDTQQALSKVKLLTTSGVDLEVGDKDGRKAALYASVHHNAEVLNVLLGAGADVKGLQDASGSTVLTHVVEYGTDVDVVDALVGAGLPVDEENKEGYTGLQWAAQKVVTKSADFISKLLAKGADVNKANAQQEDRTALIFAVQSGNVAAVKVLLNAEGIDIGQADATGKTASTYAADNAEIAALIAAKSPSVPTLAIDPATLSFTPAVGTKTVAVELSDADSWTVGTPVYTDGAGWLTATQGTGDDVNVLEVTVLAHTGTAARSGSVSLTPAQGSTTGEAVSLSVTQAGTSPSLTLSATTLSFTATGVAQTVAITLVNVNSWTVGDITYTDGAGWITTSVDTNTPNTLTVAVGKHTGTTDRSGSVELTPAEGESVSLSVTQTSPPSLTLSAASLSFTTTAVGTEKVVVELSNADSWTVGDITYTDGAGWLTAEKGTGADANTLTVGVSENADASPRSGSVALTPTASGTNGEVVTLSVTQAGTSPSLTVSPTELSFAATEIAAKTVVVTLYSADTWSVGALDGSNSWIKATQGTGDAVKILTVTVDANTDITDRIGSVVFTPTASGTSISGAPVSLSVTQTGTAPRLSVDPTGLSFTSSETGAKTVAVTLSYANSWTVGDLDPSDSWIKAAKDANTLTVTVEANTGATAVDRSGSVTLTPAQDGTTGTAVVLNITQTSPPTLTLLPTSLSFTAVASDETVTITLTNVDTWFVSAVSTTDNTNWLTATPGTGVSAHTLEVTVEANTGATAVDRSGSVELTPAGGGTTGESVSLSVTQTSPPTLTLLPTSLSFTAVASDETVTITLTNATSWTVEDITYTDGAGWLTATPGTGAAANTLTVGVSAHTGTEVRTGNIVLTPAGGEAVSLPVTQERAVPSLSVGPTTLSFRASETDPRRVTITLVGGVNSWSVGDITYTDGDGWITVDKGTGADVNILTVELVANTGTADRSGSVELTPDQGDAVTLRIIQTSPPSLTLDPASLKFTAAGGAKRVEIELSNADDWGAFGPNWITISKDTDNSLILEVTVGENTGATRSGDITLTPTEGNVSGVQVKLPVSQDGAGPSLSLEPTSLSSTNPDKLSFTATATAPKAVTILLTLATTWTSATAYTDGDGWITATKGTGADVNILTVELVANTGTAARSGSVELTPIRTVSGGTDITGDPVTLLVSQAGTLPSLSIAPTSLSVASAASDQTVTISLGDGTDTWSVEVTAGAAWISTSVADAVNAPNTLTVELVANTGTAARSGSVELTPIRTVSGGTDITGTPVSLQVDQAGILPGLSIDPDELDFTSAASDQTVAITLEDGTDTWSVSLLDPLDTWITTSVDASTPNTLTVAVQENAGTAARSGSVVLTPIRNGVNGGTDITGTPVSLPVSQARPLPGLSIAPTSLSVASAASDQAVTISLTPHADSWSVSLLDPSDTWITTSVDASTPNTLTVRVSENAGAAAAARSGSVVLTPIRNVSGGTDITGTPVSLQIDQARPLPGLSIDPTSLSVASAASDQTVTISLTPHADSWSVTTVTTTDNVSWLTATKGTGTDVNTLTVELVANTGTAARSGSVELTPIRTVSGGTDITGTPVSLPVSQARPLPGLSIDPTSLSVASAASDQTVAITLTPHADTWSVEVTAGDAWISTSVVDAANAPNILTVAVQENAGTAARSGSVVLTPIRTVSGGTDITGATVTLQVDQARPLPGLSIDPTSLSVASAASDQTVAITLEDGTDTWSVEVTAGDAWITATKGTGTDVNTLTVELVANTGTAARSGSVVLTPIRTVSGGTDITGTPVSLPVSQARPLPGLSIDPTSLSFASAASAQTVAISLTHATTWSVTAVSPPDSWLTATKSNTDDAILDVAVEANTSATAVVRTGSVELTPTRNGTTGDPVRFTISQELPSPSLSIDPTSLSFTSAEGTESVTITLTHATTWSVEVTAGAAWIQTSVEDATNAPNTLTVRVSENADAAAVARTGSVVLTPTRNGTTGTPVTLPVSQELPPPGLAIDPQELNFTSVAGTESVTITLFNANSWSVTSVSEAWLGAAVSNTNTNVLDVTVQENAENYERTGSVVLTPAQGSTTGSTFTLLVEQDWARPLLTIGGSTRLDFAPAAGSQTVEIALLNADTWSVVVEQGGVSTSVNGNTLTVTVTENTGDEELYSAIRLTPIVTGVDGNPDVSGIYVYLEVYQAWPAPTLSLVPERLDFTATETGAQTVTVSFVYDADDWELGTHDNWITATKGTGAGANILTVSVSENTGTDTRSGGIALKPIKDNTLFRPDVILPIEQAAGTGN